MPSLNDVTRSPSAHSAYRWLRKTYLGFPLGFESKRRIKDALFRPVAFFWPEAWFLKEWQAKRRFEQRLIRLVPPGAEIYGGEDELKLLEMLLHWKDLLDLNREQVDTQLIPLLQHKLRSTHLTKAGTPEVSVVIPCFGKVNYTLACLESLTHQETSSHFEILLADDHPTDLGLITAATRLGCQHLHYHSNGTNLGFTRNVNLAAQRARGELLVILNNDTYCHPHWLEMLVSTYRRLAENGPVGAIGSKVLHSSLAVQESGCLMLPGPQPHPLGRGAHAFDPRYSFLREVDFVSACSLLMGRGDFLDCGGFNERFSPGYFEDPDLCERLRQKGLPSYVQPTSLLLHEEGVSFGKDGFEKVVAEKAALYQQLHPSPSSSLPSFENRPRLLFIDAYLPMPDKGSGSVDAMAYLEHFLRLGFQPIVYAHHHNNYFEIYTQALESRGIEVLQDNFLGLEGSLRERAEEIQVVFISRFYQMDHFLPMIKRHLGHAKLIYNTVDLHFLREGREANLADNASEKWLEELKSKELSYIRSADASIVISSYEHDLLQKLMPDLKRVHHIPQFRPYVGTTCGHEERSGFLFIGSAHQPNVDALRFFQEAIHPLLVEQLPDYSLAVIGKELMESLSASQDHALLGNPHIRFLGYLEDVSPLFDRSLAMVVPLRYGSGIKGKVVQAIQHALPCVTTSIGAEGLDLPAQSSVLVADDPLAIVNGLQALSASSRFWTETSARAQSIFEERFSRRIFEARLDNLMGQIGARESIRRQGEVELKPLAQPSAAAARGGGPEGSG
jgi:GT2 family glycosyltransferase